MFISCDYCNIVSFILFSIFFSQDLGFWPYQYLTLSEKPTIKRSAKILLYSLSTITRDFTDKWSVVLEVMWLDQFRICDLYESFYEPFGMKRGVMSCNRMILDELKSTLPDKISKKKRLARKKQLYPNLNMEQLDRATLDMGKYIEKASEKKKKGGYRECCDLCKERELVCARWRNWY